MAIVRFLIMMAFLASSAIASPIADEHARSIKACKTKLLDGTFKHRVEFASCVNIANAKAWLALRGTANFDLMENAASQERLAAFRFDKKQISSVEYWAIRSRIKSELISELKLREAVDAAAHPRSVTCYTHLGVTNCY